MGSCFHHAAFQVAWDQMQTGVEAISAREYCDLRSIFFAFEELIRCISRLYDDERHPQLLELYHTMAELSQGNVEDQQYYLRLEREVVVRGYPEEAERQDQEIWNLVQGRGPHSAP